MVHLAFIRAFTACESTPGNRQLGHCLSRGAMEGLVFRVGARYGQSRAGTM